MSARAKGDVVASLLPLVDNFELARTQVKAETEAEQKINNSYQVSCQPDTKHALRSNRPAQQPLKPGPTAGRACSSTCGC